MAQLTPAACDMTVFPQYRSNFSQMISCQAWPHQKWKPLHGWL